MPNSNNTNDTTPAAKKNKNRKKKKSIANETTPTAAVQCSNAAAAITTPLLFPTIETRSGSIRTVFNTNNTTAMLQSIPGHVVQQQLDTVLDAVRTLDTTCDFDRCRTKTSLMHLDCDHCRHRFCFKHGLPEVHGCGEAVRRLERDRFMHPVPQKTRQNETDLKAARIRMEQRLKEMNLARKAKPPMKKPM